MSALIRQVVVLAVLWAACEMLLPVGTLQQMVRMTVSALVLTALLSTAGQTLHSQSASPPLAQQAAAYSATAYRQTILRSAANQTADYLKRLAYRAGYDAEVSVWLTQEGGVDAVELTARSLVPMMKPDRLVGMMADQLGISREKILFMHSGAGEP